MTSNGWYAIKPNQTKPIFFFIFVEWMIYFQKNCQIERMHLPTPSAQAECDTRSFLNEDWI